MEVQEPAAPKFWSWALSIAASAGLTGMLCCVAPMFLFMMGLMSGIYAISFADFFYTEDGAPAAGAWLLRASAVLMGVLGVWRYHLQQRACSLDPQDQKKNLMLLGFLVTGLGLGLFLTLERLSSWYFDTYIVPAQQAEYAELP